MKIVITVSSHTPKADGTGVLVQWDLSVMNGSNFKSVCNGFIPLGATKEEIQAIAIAACTEALGLQCNASDFMWL